MDKKTELAINLGQTIYNNTINSLIQQRDEALLDAERFAWLIENVIEYKTAHYDGCEFGRFDMFLRSDIDDIRKAIDKERG